MITNKKKKHTKCLFYYALTCLFFLLIAMLLAIKASTLAATANEVANKPKIIAKINGVVSVLTKSSSFLFADKKIGIAITHIIAVMPYPTPLEINTLATIS